MATIEQLEAALRKADAAGNADDARQLAAAIRQMRPQQGQQAAPDFSKVQGGFSGASGTGPSLEQANAQNRATWDPAAYEAQQNELRGDAYRKLPALLRFAGGVGEPVDRLIRGTASLFQSEKDRGIADLIHPGGPTPMERQESQARGIADATVKSDGAGQFGRFVGDTALLAAPLSRLKAGYTTAMVGGGVYGALQPTAEGESRLMNAGTGAALGAVGQKLGGVLEASGKRAAAAITPEVKALYESAKARGITLTPAQLSDSKALKFLQSQLSRMPIVGGSKRADKQVATFNRELAGEIGEDAPVVTPEVYARAKTRQSEQFNDLTGRNSLNVSPDLVRRLEAVRSESGMAGKDAKEAVSNALDNFYTRLSGGTEGGAADGSLSGMLGGMPGKAYQSLDAELGQVTKLGTPASHYVGQLRSAIREAMDDSISPADATAWRELRQQYGNRKTLRDLVAKGDGGPIPPAALMGRVTANNAGKEAMASGRRGSLGDLARIGQRIKDPQSSGTAERLAPVLLGAAGATNLPMTLAALLGGGALKEGLDSGALARFLLRESRGQTRQRLLAPSARSSGAAATPVVIHQRTDDSRKRK